MKTHITILLSAILMGICITASADRKDIEDWKKKFQSEKIAFLTLEANITPEEAQVFWPVYNKVSKEKDEVMLEVFKAFKELDTAVNDNKPEKEIESLLNRYLSAQEKQRQIDGKTASEYKKVLPVDKVARLFIAEEKFRRQHIRKLHGNGAVRPEPRR